MKNPFLFLHLTKGGWASLTSLWTAPLAVLLNQFLIIAMGNISRKPGFSRRHGGLPISLPSYFLLRMPFLPLSLLPLHRHQIPLIHHFIPPISPLRNLRSRFTLIRLHGMQHNLINPLRCIIRIPLTPIITNRIRKNISSPIKRRARYCATHLRIPLQSMLRIFVPKMKRAV